MCNCENMTLWKHGNGRVPRQSSRVLVALAVSILAYFHNVTIAYSSTPRRLFDETPAEKAGRLSWWTHDRFGMFIHFGLYSLPAKGEWVKMTERVGEEKYQEYFENFNPDLFDAKEWAKEAKKLVSVSEG